MKPDYEKIEELFEILLAQDVLTEWVMLTPGQYRLNGVLDIYPKSRKYFYVPTDERGYYQDLEDFIRLIL